MSGAFYGSLAASASVFVAILTALLVNNYIQIKSERRQLTRRINQVKRDLKDLQEDKEGYQDTIEQIEKEEEQENRKEAEDNIDRFIQDHLYDDFTHPIETLDIDELYRELLDYYGRDSSDELEDSGQEHHREILEERIEKIEKLVLNRTVNEFVSQYQERINVKNPLEKDDADFSESDEEFLDEVDFGMDLEDFLDKYKQEYDVDDLDDRTLQVLEREYNEVVTKDQSDKDFGELPPTEGQVAEILAETLGSKASEIDSGHTASTVGEVIEEGNREQRFQTARDNLIQVKSEIESLERTKEDLQQQKEGQHPEDLKPTLYVNAATIFFSVVVPMAAYLDAVTEFTVTQLHWINIWLIFASWLLGLIIVFIAIYLRITGREVRKYLAQKSP